MGNRIRGEGTREDTELEQGEIIKEEEIESIGRLMRNKAVGADGKEGECLQFGGDS